MKIVEVQGRSHLCLFALRDINPDEELHYYGDGNWPSWVQSKKQVQKKQTNKVGSQPKATSRIAPAPSTKYSSASNPTTYPIPKKLMIEEHGVEAPAPPTKQSSASNPTTEPIPNKVTV